MLGILQTAEKIQRGEISPVAITEECLSRIAKYDASLNTFITVTKDSALAEARQAEEEIRLGNWRGPLHGIPLALKDLIDTAGVRTTAASAVFRSRIPDKDAEIARRLKNAGAVLLGKQNLHEFAYGGSSIVSCFGPVRNPWNPQHIAGGSSGGSAAAVAAEFCYGAIGTDTAGSIREPAAQCGVVGLKPTYGLVSTAGVFPLSPSLDHAGPITGTVTDAAILFQCLSGTNDGINILHSVPGILKERMGPLRIGVPRKFFFENLHPEVSRAVEEALSVIGKFATEVHEISLEVSTDRTLQMAESYASHAELLETNSKLYQPETLRRILAGQNITERVMIQSRRELEEQRQRIRSIFTTVDVLVTPTTPIPAPAIIELQQNPEQLRERELELLRNTRPFNVWGLPAISIPCGFTSEGLPIGLQLAGPLHQENSVLRLAHAYEQATIWHKRIPHLEVGSSR
jgi:aspartyl-tRNA(Asn)/glutamyl-tRNA(Gln) amidotransferase subunit A